jgi:hypothetical protein
VDQSAMQRQMDDLQQQVGKVATDMEAVKDMLAKLLQQQQ